MLIYINNHSKKLTKEEFSDGLFIEPAKYKATNPYDLIDKNFAKPIELNDENNWVVAYNENPSGNTSQSNWIINNSDYSDIFNGQDLGGEQIVRTLDMPKPKIFLDKAMAQIKPNGDELNIKPLGQAHREQIIGEAIGEVKTQLTSPNGYPLEITNQNLKYHLLGYAHNIPYKQYYLIYEAVNKQLNPNLVLREKLDNFEAQVFTYALVKITESKPDIKYIFGPRAKINTGDVVYLSQGPLQIGPLKIDRMEN